MDIERLDFSDTAAIRDCHRATTQWFVTAEPLVERIHTSNSKDNVHMIAINEALGYRVLGPVSTRWRMDLGR
ncbi:MAG TPA: hypothetical protein VFB06_12615 [Streptosporangiaceae bacterium]|nr:hypothetical protein [Streptosporangiaceae bacterium]